MAALPFRLLANRALYGLYYKAYMIYGSIASRGTHCSLGIASAEICKSVSLILQGADNRHGEQSAGFAWPSRKNKTAELSRFIV